MYFIPESLCQRRNLQVKLKEMAIFWNLCYSDNYPEKYLRYLVVFSLDSLASSNSDSEKLKVGQIVGLQKKKKVPSPLLKV